VTVNSGISESFNVSFVPLDVPTSGNQQITVITIQYNKFKVKNDNGTAITLQSTGGKMKKTRKFLV